MRFINLFICGPGKQPISIYKINIKWELRILRKFKNSKYFEVLLIVLIFIISFISFNYFFSGAEAGGYYQNIISALMGTLFTIVITSFLLKQQAKSEEIREQNVEVFKKKVEKYENLIELLSEVTKDGIIDQKEAVILKKSLYEISLFCGKDVLLLITNFIKQELIGSIVEDEKITILEITSTMRKELHLEDIESFDSKDIKPLEILIDSNFEILLLYKSINIFITEVRDLIDEKVYDMERGLYEISAVEHMSNVISFSIRKHDSDELDFYSIQVEYPSIINKTIELEFSFVGYSGRFHYEKDESLFLEASKIGVEYILDEEEPKEVNGMKQHTLLVNTSHKITNNPQDLADIIFQDILDTEIIICKYKNANKFLKNGTC
jgi:hypothetical protein